MKIPAILLLLAGCFSKPGAPGAPGDGSGSCVPSQPSASGLQVDLGAAPRVMFAGNASLGFASDVSRYPMPTSLQINGRELIPPAAGCTVEDQVGVAVYPVYSISGNDAVSAGSHVLDPEIVGPAFTQLRTRWQFEFPSCNVNPTVAAGTTRWGLFPDGRIVRNDVLVPAQNESIGLTEVGCACPNAGGATHFVVTSYFALQTSLVTSVTTTQNTEPTTPPSLSSAAINNAAAGCARVQGDGRIAVRWDVVGAVQPVPYPTRVRTAMGPQAIQTAFVYDMVPQGQATQIPMGTSYGVRTHMLVDGSNTRDCVEMTADVGAYPTANMLTVGGVTVPYGEQGIYEDARSHSEPVEIAATNGTIFGGFVVGLLFPGVSAIRTSPVTEGVVWQRGANDMFHVFFPDALPTGSSITITPEC